MVGYTEPIMSPLRLYKLVHVVRDQGLGSKRISSIHSHVLIMGSDDGTRKLLSEGR